MLARSEHRDHRLAQILALYGLLDYTTQNPIATLNRAVAEAMVHGPDAGLSTIDSVPSRIP